MYAKISVITVILKPFTPHDSSLMISVTCSHCSILSYCTVCYRPWVKGIGVMICICIPADPILSMLIRGLIYPKESTVTFLMYCVCIMNSYSTLVNWPILSLLILFYFILFGNVCFCILYMTILYVLLVLLVAVLVTTITSLYNLTI